MGLQRFRVLSFRNGPPLPLDNNTFVQVSRPEAERCAAALSQPPSLQDFEDVRASFQVGRQTACRAVVCGRCACGQDAVWARVRGGALADLLTRSSTALNPHATSWAARVPPTGLQDLRLHSIEQLLWRQRYT